MKRVFFLLLIGLVLMGCATPRFVPIKAGKVVFFHWNEGVYGHAVLFKDSLLENEMFAVDPKTGSLIWANPIVDSFVIQPAKARDWPRINYIYLTPEADYTFYIFWTRFNGRELDGNNIIHFRPHINSRYECRTSNLGQVTCASVIIDLPWVDASAPGRFSFHKTLYVGDWIKALFGLP